MAQVYFTNSLKLQYATFDTLLHALPGYDQANDFIHEDHFTCHICENSLYSLHNSFIYFMALEASCPERTFSLSLGLSWLLGMET